ncbi:Ubiquitin carboxyl-terminal hydrolase 48 [Phlyctochytrium planicorne]|nr:Ubiquitin carboxyl-terminal hydrolase 48 [Phlyctochytrium planicorne]
MKEAIPRLRQDLDDPTRFKDLYQFTFNFAKAEGQRSLTLDVAVAYWSLLLKDRFEHLDDWIEFVTDHYKKSISKDTWNLFLDFVRTSEKDFKNHDSDDAYERFASALGFNEKSQEEVGLLRDGDGPVGLENLSATCYMNAFLQIWFHDVTFRNVIYGIELGNNNAANDVFEDIQRLFCCMDIGNRRTCSPRKLATVLNIQGHLQQDAQEFGKLFMTFLESLLSEDYQNQSRLLLRRQFEGVILRQTRCLKCGFTSDFNDVFTDLNLSIELSGELEECIRGIFQEERLVDDNKYFCAQCNEKQDSVRTAEFRSLPETLVFNFIRSSFNTTNAKKSKETKKVAFPMVLNLGRFSGQAFQDCKYHLSGAILHIGKNADSGHYIAITYCQKTKRWYRFNDEVVESFEDLVENMFDDIEETKKRKGKKTETYDRFQSNAAYILFYKKYSLEPTASAIPAPPKIISEVLEENRVADKYQRLFNERVTRNVTFRDTYSILDAAVADSYFLPLSALKSIVAFPESNQTRESYQLAVEANVIDCKQLQCMHGALDPLSLYDSKRIKADKIEEFQQQFTVKVEPLLKNSNICTVCLSAVCERVARVKDHERCVVEARKIMKQKFTEPRNHVVSLPAFKQWSAIPTVQEVSPFSSPFPDWIVSMQCVHSGLNPCPDRWATLSDEAFARLQSLIPQITSLDVDSNPACEICLNDIELVKRILQESCITDMHALLSLTSTDDAFANTFQLVSNTTEFLRGLRVQLGKRRIHEKFDLDPSLELFCSHGLLKRDLCKLESWDDSFSLFQLSVWQTLLSFFEVSTESLVTATGAFDANGEFTVTTSAAACAECVNAGPSKFYVTITREGANTAKAEDDGTKRRSKRSRTQAEISFQVTDKTTILDLKVMIMAKWQTTPLYQQLFFEGNELENTLPVWSCGVVQGKTILLKELEHSDKSEVFDVDAMDVGNTNFEGAFSLAAF